MTVRWQLGMYFSAAPRAARALLPGEGNKESLGNLFRKLDNFLRPWAREKPMKRHALAGPDCAASLPVYRCRCCVTHFGERHLELPATAVVASLWYVIWTYCNPFSLPRFWPKGGRGQLGTSKIVGGANFKLFCAATPPPPSESVGRGLRPDFGRGWVGRSAVPSRLRGPRETGRSVGSDDSPDRAGTGRSVGVADSEIAAKIFERSIDR